MSALFVDNHAVVVRNQCIGLIPVMCILQRDLVVPSPSEANTNGTTPGAAAAGGGSTTSPAAAAVPGMNQLAWLPPTVASISLRLAALDAALVYRDGEKPWRDSAPVRNFSRNLNLFREF